VGFGAVAATAAYAYSPPVYAAPVYAAPVYYGSPSIGYYNPPGTVVVEQSPRRDVKKTERIPQSATLAKVQSKLTALGYYKGDIDGAFGPQTELAITKFQSENGLAVTGRLDLKTLSSLGITL
jgi:His-Xaa-Ser repeat protein HxsA